MTGGGEMVNRLSITGSCLPQVLSLLEILCGDEDKGVREKAVKDLYDIGIRMNETLMLEHFVPLIQRLVDNGQPSGRASACTLLNAPYHTLSKSLKTKMHSAYSTLCRDSEPLVRQEAATNLCWFAATVDSDCFEHDVMSLLQHFMADDDEFVRSSAIESCGALHSLLDMQVFIDYILPVFKRGTKDPSIRVRDTVANQVHLICNGSSAGILHAASAGNLPQMKEAKEVVSFQGALGIIGVCTVALCGVYFGVVGLKDGVTGLKEGVTAGSKELVGVVAREIRTVREGWFSKGCPPLINVTVYLWKKK